MKPFLNTMENLFVSSIDFLGNQFLRLIKFLQRFHKCFLLMSVFERRASVLLFVVAIVLFGIKFKTDYFNNTVSAPSDGGIYKEAVFGDIKYTNPISVSSDAEKSLSRLLFSGLVKFDKDNNVVPDVAEKWEVSPDGLKYTFTLKDNVFFQNGEKLKPDDVVYTIDMIHDPASKSPLEGAWKDVTVTADDANNAVIFELPRAYGPFIYNCDFGILPSSIPPDQFSKKLIGSGPYKFVNSKSKDGLLTNVSLSVDENYFGGKSYISKIELDLFKDKNEARSAFLKGEYNAVSGVGLGKDNILDLSVTTEKRLGLLFNLRNDKFKDLAVRQKIIGTEKLPEKLNLTLTTSDSDLQKEKAEGLKKEFEDRNIDLSVKYLNPVEMKDTLDEKNYELLLYGFDFGHDRDPYSFWHSSQISQSNFSGFSDKKADLFLEDARMTLDATARNALYDQFFAIVKNEAVAVFYDPIKFPFYVNEKPRIKGISLNCSEVECRFSNIEDWFLKEKRIRKSENKD